MTYSKNDGGGLGGIFYFNAGVIAALGVTSFGAGIRSDQALSIPLTPDQRAVVREFSLRASLQDSLAQEVAPHLKALAQEAADRSAASMQERLQGQLQHSQRQLQQKIDRLAPSRS